MLSAVTLPVTLIPALAFPCGSGVRSFVALSVAAIVCIASSNGGSTSQDLKTGYLVGATPRSQQISILLGAFVSALVLGPILLATALALVRTYVGMTEEQS